MPPKRKKISQEKDRDVEGEKGDLLTQPLPTFPRKKSEYTAIVDRLKRAIRKKDNWRVKINDPVIRSRYIEEAIAQGIQKELMEAALNELEVYEYSSESLDFKKIVINNQINHADGLIPNDLRDSIEAHLDKIANQPEKDFHPHSDGKVQDLIHPSLYPYILPEDKKLKPAQSNRTYYHENRKPREVSSYQWLPAEFKIWSNPDRVKIASYINNLEQDKYPELYSDIEKTFQILLPMVRNCVEGWNIPDPNDEDGDDYEEEEEEEEEDGLEDLNASSSQDDDGSEKWQVIVKACNYILKPGEVYEGSWHIEGMPHENIVASAIYYYASSTDLDDLGLAFRVENKYHDNEYGPPGKTHWTGSTPLGALRTNAGRVIVFSNRYQHCVTRLTNTSKTDTATRKILCFFVVNPKKRIVSTKDIPPQQWDIVSKKLRWNLLLVGRRLGHKLPKDVVNHIVDYARTGMTLEEAKEHRLNLMKERKYFTSELNVVLEREYSLCEH